jgi:hypothetical protein
VVVVLVDRSTGEQLATVTGATRDEALDEVLDLVSDPGDVAAAPSEVVVAQPAPVPTPSAVDLAIPATLPPPPGAAPAVAVPAPMPQATSGGS